MITRFDTSFLELFTKVENTECYQDQYGPGYDHFQEVISACAYDEKCFGIWDQCCNTECKTDTDGHQYALCPGQSIKTTSSETRCTYQKGSYLGKIYSLFMHIKTQIKIT